MKLKQKVLVGFLTTASLLTVLGIGNIYVNRNFNKLANEISKNTINELIAFSEIQIASLRIINAVKKETTTVAEFEAEKAKLDEWLGKIERRENISEKAEKLSQLSREIRELNGEELKGKLEELATIETELMTAIELGIDERVEIWQQETEEVKRKTELGLITNLIAMLSLSGIVGSLGIICSKRLSQKLLEIKEATGKILAGEFETKIGLESDDEVGGIVTSINEMARKLEEKIKRENSQNNIIQVMGEPLIVINEKLQIKEVNQAAIALSGYEATELLNSPIDSLINILSFRETEAGTDKEIWEKGETNLLTKDGRQIPVSVSIQTKYKKGEELEEIICLIQDISARKEYENQLIAAKETALETARLKSEFINNMSHEIRTPLNGVLGMTQLLLMTELDNTQKHYVESLEESGQQLQTITQDILDFSKLEAGKMQLVITSFNLHKSLEEIVFLLTPKAKSKGIETKLFIEQNVPQQVEGDERRLRQIIINLLDNGIKFTKQGEILVSVNLIEEKEKQTTLKFIVKDTGIGIAKTAQNKIFTSFSQVDGSLTRKYGGMGLGLAICKKLVEMMGGEIGFNSEMGVGSTFWFIVTLGKIEEEITGEKSPVKTTKNIKILLVEDMALNRMVELNQLKKLGYHADYVENGQEALDKLATQNYDIVLMDCQMPVMDGYEATRRIREKEGNSRHTIIIAVTANVLEGDAQKCFDAGMDDYLPKPVSQALLAATIEKWSATISEECD